MPGNGGEIVSTILTGNKLSVEFQLASTGASGVKPDDVKYTVYYSQRGIGNEKRGGIFLAGKMTLDLFFNTYLLWHCLTHFLVMFSPCGMEKAGTGISVQSANIVSGMFLIVYIIFYIYHFLQVKLWSKFRIL